MWLKRILKEASKRENHLKNIQNMRTPTRPICVVLEYNGFYYAQLLNPKGKAIEGKDIEWYAKGPNEAIGALEDKGYEISKVLKTEHPKWVSNRVPKPYNIFGICNITGFPF